jgi:2-amino-4-hydroxy-6-hydroxymethyldihydropteridine diphosphokinase
MPVAYIGMGANLPSITGPPEATLTAAAERLGSLGRVIARSKLYTTTPVGFANQPRFVNAVIALETDLEPRHLLHDLLAIEQEFGRDRSNAVRNGPRTLDLDILLFGDVQLSEPGLEIPHPRLAERAFALAPLAEIAPDITAARLGLPVKQLLHQLRNSASSGDDAPIPIQWDDWPTGACPAGDGDCSLDGTGYRDSASGGGG